MKNLDTVALVREIRDMQFKEINQLKGSDLKKYFAEKAKWAHIKKKAISTRS